MKIEILLADNTVTSVQAMWHGDTVSRTAPGQDVFRPGSLWTTKSKLIAHLEKVNRSRAKAGIEGRSVEAAVETALCAEAPLEVYVDTEDGEPWRHFGTLARKIPYGEAEFGIRDRA